MEKHYSANLDILRAIAVLLVLAQHLSRRLSVDYVLGIPTRSLGFFGVLLFFVHTCLVLMFSLERSRLTGWPLMKNFYVRRIFRIYPLSIITVLIALGLRLESNVNGIAGLSYGSFPGPRVALSNLLLVQNLASTQSIVNVLWSLPFELQMYLFLPCIFLWIRNKRALWYLLGLWTLATVVGTVQPHIHELHLLSILQFIPNFLPGVIAFVLPHVPRFRSFAWPILILALVAAFTFRPTVWMGWILCLILGLSIPFFAETRHRWLCLASNRIAMYSYGIYLSHQFCIWIAFGLLASSSLWLRVPVLIVSLVVFPVVMYHLIEKPMIRVGVRLAEALSKPRNTPLELAPMPQAGAQGTTD